MHLECNNIFKPLQHVFTMALDNNQKFDEFIENFRRKNGYSENESRRDEILTLHSHYLFKAEESRLPKKFIIE